ncbi:hypothetical protein CDL12_24631 [Handroanthus impetiginosus]|uniref:Small auxin-up RNA n=1 Tax=Handroanthus impetiginosus TaxID=429701 RepID=A0A2G9GC35_9LAMI|nr:hypothetical protein CDL12_24631 [Handroanthus impetiginosus]
MDSPRGKSKKGLISKTWERCKSFSGGIGRNQEALKRKSKSLPHGNTKDAPTPKNGIKRWSRWRWAPEGCFSIYVGPEKQRFVIKTKYVNHPLFKILLEEAESEYGYSSDGPLLLPCGVDHFIKVVMEMDCEEINIGKEHQAGCNFVARSHTSYHLLTPPRLFPINYILNY